MAVGCSESKSWRTLIETVDFSSHQCLVVSDHRSHTFLLFSKCNELLVIAIPTSIPSFQINIIGREERQLTIIDHSLIVILELFCPFTEQSLARVQSLPSSDSWVDVISAKVVR